MVSTQLAQIAKKAKLDRKVRFTSLAHLITPEFLKDSCVGQAGSMRMGEHLVPVFDFVPRRSVLPDQALSTKLSVNVRKGRRSKYRQSLESKGRTGSQTSGSKLRRSRIISRRRPYRRFCFGRIPCAQTRRAAL